MTAFTFDSSIISDLYKDARGFRPGREFFQRWEEASSLEKQQIWDGLSDELDRELDRERQQQAKAVDEYELALGKIQSTVGCDRVKAVELYVESLNFDKSDLSYGGGFVAFRTELPYTLEAELDAACKALLKKM